MGEAALGGRPVDIVVESTIPIELLVANVEASFRRDVPRLSALPGLGEGTGPVAIVAGGPSLNDTIESARTFPGPVIACGTVHDHLISLGVVPKYQVLFDPDEIIARFLTPHPDVTYLVASCCHAAVFDKLEGYDVRIWHAESFDIKTGASVVDFHGEPTIGGGDCVVLRAWPIAAVLGYRQIHFYGFDCSFPAACESQHAYQYDWVREEPIGITVEETGQRFMSAPGWLAQLGTFRKMLAMGHDIFNVTVHGDSLVAAMCCKP